MMRNKAALAASSGSCTPSTSAATTRPGTTSTPRLNNTSPLAIASIRP